MNFTRFSRFFCLFAASFVSAISWPAQNLHAQTVSVPSPLPGIPELVAIPEGAIWPWQGSDLAPDPSVTYGRLPNGMRYAIRPNKLPEGSVSLQFRVDAGAQYERDDQRGFAHFVEHMVFNGSTNIPEGELTKTMERLGASFGSDVNARVTYDDALYFLDIPRVDGGRLETALKIFRETADRLLFDEAAVKREIGVVLSELNDSETPFRQVGRRTAAFLTPDDRRISREPIGQRAIIEGATGLKLREFYEAWYRPERTILVIAGDVDVEATKAQIVALFSDWQPKSATAPADPDDGVWPKADLRALIQVEPELPSVISVTAQRPDEFDYSELDQSAIRKWWLLHGIAEDIFERRLATMQLIDNPPASGVGYSATSSDNGWSSRFYVVPRGDDWERGLRAVVTELRQAMEIGFNSAEIAEAVKESLVGYDQSISGAGTRRTSSLASSVMSSLSGDFIYQTPQDRKKLFEEVAAMATPENLRQAFSWWWRGVDPAIVLMAKAAVPGGEEAIKAVWTSAMNAPLPAREVYVRATYTPTEIGAPGRLVSTQVRRDPDATIARFDNGVTFAFKQTAFSADRISISINYGAGSLAFPLTEKNWALYGEAAWNGDGVGALTRDQMITALAGRSTSMAGTNIGFANASLFASPRRADLSEQLQVMLSQVREPRLGPRAASLFRDSMKAGWDSINQTAQGMFGLYSSTYFYQGLPTFDPPTLEGYLRNDDTRSLENLRKILATAPINVTIVGDTTFEAARDAVAATFGALPYRAGIDPGFAQLKAWGNMPAGGPVRSLQHKGSQNQAIAHVSWLTPGSKNVVLSNEFYVLSQVLQLRLTAKVREAAGESYSPDGGWASESLVDLGRLYAHANVTPNHVSDVNTMIDVIARELGTAGPTQDEINRVVGPAIEARGRARQSNNYWVGLLNTWGLPQAPGYQRGDPLALQKGMEGRLRSITPARLKRLAARYMVPSNAIRVQVVPTPVVAAPTASSSIPIG